MGEGRGAEGDHDVVGPGGIGGTVEQLEAAARSAGGTTGEDPIEHLLGARLLEGHPTRPQRRELGRVMVDSDDGETEVGEAQREGQADPAEADHRDPSWLAHNRLTLTRP